jgi:hypothetical protein
MCVYGVLEHGVVKCGIEKACNDHRISFKKPISCHLYPIRVQSYDGYEAMEEFARFGREKDAGK